MSFDFYNRNVDERARARSLPALNVVLLQALALSLPPADYFRYRALEAIRHTTISTKEEREAREEATRLGWMDRNGALTDAGRSGAFGLLAAV